MFRGRALGYVANGLLGGLNAAQATADVVIRLVNGYESMRLVPPTGGQLFLHAIATTP